MMSLWDALRMNMMISYQELVRTFLSHTRSTSPILSGSTIEKLTALCCGQSLSGQLPFIDCNH
ncbi:hypothetical protein NXF57_29795, partial [Klebsiella pneumoniae]|nr:hypothetical protein [Klebsiella pneumoniae]MDS6903277.1 hypothetical protein [Klebsiella pneumoniae]MDS6925959.1 hypothetical protein [Klebsiella pneumoniae]MDS6942740.1 hypothetical protein [Klebsiella pneumoniae]